MKPYFALLAAAFLVVTGSRSLAQTLDWGSEVFSDLADSEGNPLDSMFVFELGSFVNGFVPDETNVHSWISNWRVFDSASFDGGLGYFTSTVQMNDDGTSSNPTASAINFQGLSAYLWIRNDDDAVEGSEWLLTRSDSWTFPGADPGCCDNETPLQWSVSDLDGGDTPIWGSQGGVEGSGFHTDGDPHTLQTYTFVPEPSTAVLAGLACACAALRRRRNIR